MNLVWSLDIESCTCSPPIVHCSQLFSGGQSAGAQVCSQVLSVWTSAGTYSTEVCKKSQTKVVIEWTFTSSLIAANESYLCLTEISNLHSSSTFNSPIHHRLQLSNTWTAITPPCIWHPSTKPLLLQPPSALSKLTATMVKWDEEHKLKMLLAIIEHLNPTSLPWDKLASAMGPEFTSEAVR